MNLQISQGKYTLFSANFFVGLRALSNLLKGGENFGLAEEIRISLEIQGAGRFVQLIQSTFRQTVLALTNSWLSC